jgi:hypothetical protein
MRHDSVMRAELKRVWLEPDPATLSGDPAAFALNARLMIGPADGPGEESFDVTICTPEWLSVAARGGFYDARHHVVVDFEAFDQPGCTGGWHGGLRQFEQTHGSRLASASAVSATGSSRTIDPEADRTHIDTTSVRSAADARIRSSAGGV